MWITLPNTILPPITHRSMLSIYILPCPLLVLLITMLVWILMMLLLPFALLVAPPLLTIGLLHLVVRVY